MILRTLTLAIGCSGLLLPRASGFTSDGSVLTRTFDKSTSLTNQPIIVTVTFTNSGDTALRGFFFTEQVRTGITVNTLAVKLNGVTINDYTFETGAVAAVYAGCTPHRWVLESPTNFPEANAVPAHGKVQITYTASSPSPGAFPFNQFTWAGYRANTATACFGHSENSDQQSLRFTNLLFTPLTVNIAGNGTVFPNYNGQPLQIGKTYTMTATPGAGYLFKNWTGGVTTNHPTVSFVMKSNLVLQANFVTNFYAGLKGNYYGLFAETNGTRNHDRSGKFTLTLAESGSYSASFVLGAASLAAAGRFDAFGQSLLQLRPSLTSTVSVALQLDATNLSDKIEGNVSQQSWIAPLLGFRALIYPRNNPSPAAGRYTLIVPASDDAQCPGGHGFAVLMVRANGLLQCIGLLADGTAFNQSLPLSQQGYWPFYLSLYNRQGSLSGWISFTNEPASDCHGPLSWIRPALPGARFYPRGFTNETEAVGSKYISPATTQRMLNFTNGVVEMCQGNLPTSLTNHVLLSVQNNVLPVGGENHQLRLSLFVPYGLMSGRFRHPATGRMVVFRGAVLQNQNGGFGCFAGTNQSGAVYFGP